MATRILAWLVNTFWGVVAATVIIVALFVSLGRYYLPLIDNVRSGFEKQIGAMLSAEVHADQLIGDWQGFNPIVGVEQLSVTTAAPAGATPSVIMSVGEAQLEIDMLRSLLAMAPVYREALIVGLQLHFYRAPGGGWTSPLLKGGRGVDIADLYGAAHDLRAVGTQLIFHTEDQVNIISVANISLERGQNLTQSMLSLVDNVNLAPLEIVVETSGRVGSKDFRLAAYLNAESVDLSPYQFLSNDLVQADRASLSLWAQWRTGETLRIHGKASADALSLGASLEVTAVTADVGLSFYDGRWTLYSQNIAFLSDHGALQPPRFRIDADEGIASLKLSMEGLDLARSRDFLPLLPANFEAVSAAVHALQPRGQLRNIAVRLRRVGERWRPSLLADVDDVSMSSWRGAPAFSGLDGQLQHYDQFGWFNSDPNDMTMMVPKLYQAPFELMAASGRVGWYFGDQVTIASDGISGDSNYGQFDVAFTVDMSAPTALQQQIPTLTFALNTAGTGADSVAELVPNLLATQAPKQWLKEGDLHGRIGDVKTILNTSTSKSKQWFPAIQLVANTAQADLLIGSEWPRVYLADSSLLVSHRQFKAASSSARMLAIDLSGLIVDLDVKTDGAEISFSAAGTGPIQSGLEFFQQTPLAGAIGHGADGWTGVGDFSADVAVGFHLETLPQVKAQAQLSIIDSSLNLAEADLVFEHVQGYIQYDNGTLSSQQLSAEVFGKPWQAALTTDPNRQAYYLDAQGDITMRSMADWLQQPLLLFTEGEAAASAKLTVYQDKTPKLELHSDLKGVAIDLPEPFKKVPNAALPIDATLTLGDELVVNLSSELMQFDAIISQRLRGTVSLGYQVAPLPMPEQGFVVTGYLKQIRADEATAVLARYLELDEVYPSSDEDTPVYVKQLSLGRLLLDGEFIETIGIEAHSEGEEWFVNVGSEVLTASVQWLNDTPLVVDVEQLRYPFTPYPASGSEREWAPWLPGDLIAMDLSIDKLELEGEAYGRWRFNVRPKSDGVEFTNISGFFKQVTVGGVSDQLPASLYWLDVGQGRFRSEFQGVLSANNNVKSVFEAFSLEPMLTSKRASAAINLSWPGEPFSPDHLLLSGAVNIHLKDGQFLQTEGAPTGLLKLLGIFNFDNLVRRLRLDFGDLLHEGLSYDRFDAELELTPGAVYIHRPLSVEGPSSDFRMTGALNLNEQTIDAELVAVVPVSKNLPWLAALAGGLPAAAGVYLASKIFSDEFDRFSSASYSINGPWAEPEIKFESLFDEREDIGAVASPSGSAESVEDQAK